MYCGFLSASASGPLDPGSPLTPWKAASDTSSGSVTVTWAERPCLGRAAIPRWPSRAVVSVQLPLGDPLRGDIPRLDLLDGPLSYKPLQLIAGPLQLAGKDMGVAG